MPRKAMTYVAEIFLPTSVFGRIGERMTVLHPENFGISRGYLRFQLGSDHLGTDRIVGVTLVAEVVAASRPRAEDAALSAAARLIELLSLYSGSPLEKPILRRLALTGNQGGLLEQHVYFYEGEPDNLPRIYLDFDELKRLVSWISNANEQDRDKVDLAARWYGMSVSAGDSLDAYLAAWIGLESIGAALDRKVHTSGAKARCPVCRNPAGIERDRKFAGIQHIMQITAPVLLDSFSVQQLASVRNQIAHGLTPARKLRATALRVVPDLHLCLGKAILTTLRPSGSRPGSGRLVLPRDFEKRPDAMASIVSRVELPDYEPFFGEWVELTRAYDEENSRVEADGTYVRGARVGVRIEVTVPHGAPKPRTRYQEFARKGHNFRTIADRGKRLPLRHWRYRPPTAAWSATLLQAVEASPDG